MSQILQKIAPIGESRDRTILKDAVSYVYSSCDGIELIAHVFLPETQSQELRPAVLYFHGGFWDASLASQFVPHCHHFAARGAVTITFEYRVASKHQTGPMEAIEDSRAALNWLAEHTAELNIDPKKVIFSGAAGGAYLALLLTSSYIVPSSTPRRKDSSQSASLAQSWPSNSALPTSCAASFPPCSFSTAKQTASP